MTDPREKWVVKFSSRPRKPPFYKLGRPYEQAILERVGRCLPNPEQLKAGDILLFRCGEHDESKRSATIAAFQERQHPAWDAQWYHAAIYVGNYYVCEATWKGVHVTDLIHYVGGDHDWRVLRLPELKSAQRQDIAIQARMKIDRPYGIWALPRLAWNMLRYVP